MAITLFWRKSMILMEQSTEPEAIYFPLLDQATDLIASIRSG